MTRGEIAPAHRAPINGWWRKPSAAGLATAMAAELVDRQTIRTIKRLDVGWGTSRSGSRKRAAAATRPPGQLRNWSLRRGRPDEGKGAGAGA